MLSWIGIGLLALAALALLLMNNPGDAIGIGPDDFGRLMYGIALLILIGGSVFVGQRGRGGEVLKQAVTWLGIALALVVVYSYRAEFLGVADRVMAELLPGRARVVTPTSTQGGGSSGVVAVTADRSGNFHIATVVNGTHVDMLADTGASVVVLTYRDAQRVGIDMDALKFVIEVTTANGKTLGAATTIDSLSVGGIEVRDVRAMVSQPDILHDSLLGLTYLKRIGSFQISGDQLILRQ